MIRLGTTEGTSHVYAALSYCWGSSDSIHRTKTTKDNIRTRMKGFGLADLPRTLQEAVLMTRSLQIRYIWIDALCIVQDCAEEWASEAQKMMQYYAHARVTIVPVSSETADDGMFSGSHDVPFHVKVSKTLNTYPEQSLVFSDKASQYDRGHVASSRWSSRGWTYQEKLNSSRVLYVFSNSLTLECRSGAWDTLTHCKPSAGGGFRRDATFLPAPGLPTTTVNHRFLWHIIVESFAKRAFTRPEDRWFAFSNVARAYSQGYGNDILDGLQRDWILEDIVSWSDRVAYFEHPAMASRYPDRGFCRVCHSPDQCKSGLELLGPKDASFPSWSWLSTTWGLGCGVDQGVTFSYGSVYELSPGEPCCRLLSVVDEEDRARPTMLRLAGVVMSPERLQDVVNRYYRDVDPGPFLHGCPGRGDGIVFLDKAYGPCYGSSNPRYDPYSILSSLSPPASALLMGLATFWQNLDKKERHWHFLLIQPVPPANGESELGKYRRIGTMHMRENFFETRFKDVQMKLQNQVAETILLV